ncbi:m7GpppN-mRNA hydrolase [Cloeon dipterum]|uniref:m7GpppN-mRNA hydrolase n=1 Tax=Cloeon dipterum TaxID=197152 RepID=UPI00322059DF
MAAIHPPIMEYQKNLVSSDILDDLASRFIINVPEEERSNEIRICFQIELAHWYYLDFYCKNNSSLRKCSIKEFHACMLKHIPHLNRYSSSAEKMYEAWRAYKMSVPTFGAIILNENMTHVLLVQGYYSKCSWGFPKGKVNEGEEWSRCAIREVLEETSFDISPYLRENDFLEHVHNDQLIRLYIISGVPSDTSFKPSTRCEIKSIQWFPVDQLPCTKKDTTSKDALGLGTNSFFMIIPFIRRIRNWIENKKNHRKQTPVAVEKKQKTAAVGDQDKRVKKNQQVENQQQTKASRKVAGKRVSPMPVASNGHLQKCGLRFDQDGVAIITAPSWTNFHFDHTALLKQLAS